MWSNNCHSYNQGLLLLFVLTINRNLLHVKAFAYGCPARVLIKPCTCNQLTKGMELVCEGIRLENLREVFDALQTRGQKLLYLKLNNNRLHTFPSTLLSGIEIRHLLAINSNIVTVDSAAFAGLENQIETIDFARNKFTEIPRAIKGLKSLVSLILNFNEIKFIQEKAFEGLDSLLLLSLYGNNIAQIHSNAFLGIGFNLTRINLGGNELTSIPTQSLRILKSLQRLEIHENRIKLLVKDNFRNLDNLDMLNLADNSINELQENVFADLKNLNSLDLDSNQIFKIHAHAFNGVQDTLEWLRLGGNQLREIPSHAFHNLSKLRQLDLRENQIVAVQKNSFHRFGGNIKYLYLQKNRIEVIENGAFDQMVSLEWLYLHSNNLKHIPEHLFAQLMVNIRILDFHENPLNCSCDIWWYQRWVSQRNSKHSVEIMWNATKCFIDSGPDGARQIFMRDLDQQLKCSAISLLAPVRLTANFWPWIGLIIELTITLLTLTH